MFEIGFMELIMVAVVALVVVGPERLPGLARTIGAWMGRARGFLNNVKADIDRELKAEELKHMLEQQTKLANEGLQRILEQQAAIANPVHQIIEDTKTSLNQAENQAEAGITDIKKDVESLDQGPKNHGQS